MSPRGPDSARAAPGATASVSDGATPAVPLEFALNAESPTPTDGVVVEIQGDGPPDTRSPPSPRSAAESPTMPR